MLQLQQELEAEVVKWYASTDVANMFSISAFTWEGIQCTCNQLPQGGKHSLTIWHGLI